MADNIYKVDAPAAPQANGTRVPKKRFVGRKTADAQAQRAGGSHSTAIQQGKERSSKRELKMRMVMDRYMIY